MGEEVLDRRAALEAAFEAESAREDENQPTANSEGIVPAASVDAPSNATGETPPTPTQGEVEKPAVASEGEGEKSEIPTFGVDKAPVSWRAAQKAKWATLDPDVRQEVMRREREITKTLGETAQARQLANQFSQIVTPFAARLQALGAHPLKAVEELLKADHLLGTGTKVQRAQIIAKLIKDYEVDVQELDGVLSGQGAADPVSSRVEQLLEQRLAPIKQFLTVQQQREAERERMTTAEAEQTIEQMAANTEKYPFFDELRADMADLVDISAKRGVYLSLEQAYTRAVAMNPEVSQQVAAQKDAEAKRVAAQAAHARAQKALKASVSVGGAPGGVPTGASPQGDRRATIVAAMDAIGAR